jgi:hypothetical protein
VGSRFRLDVWRTEESHSALCWSFSPSSGGLLQHPRKCEDSECFVSTDRQTTEGHHYLPGPDLGPMNLISYVCLGVALLLVGSLI